MASQAYLAWRIEWNILSCLMASVLQQTGPTSSFRGVCLDEKDGRWRAQIRVDGKKRRLGSFSTERAAALAYDRAAREFVLLASRNLP